MWELSVLGINLYHLSGWFWIYSFLGWIWETSYVSCLNKKFVNRGFVNGPVLTIYGTGAIILYVLLYKFFDQPVLLFFFGIIVSTLLEYVTGVLMEKIFHTSWWDYTDKKFNFQGKICLECSIAWGFFTLLLIYVLHPFVSFIFELIPLTVGELIISVVTVIYAIDFGITLSAALKLRDRLKSFDDIREELVAYIKNSKIAEAVEDLKKLFDGIKSENKAYKLKEHFEKTKQKLSNRISDTKSRSDILSSFDRFSNKYIKNKITLDKITKRYLKAYPKLKIKKKKNKDDAQ